MFTVDFRKYSGQTPADGMATQIVTNGGKFTLNSASLRSSWRLWNLDFHIICKMNSIWKEDFGPLSNSAVLYLHSRKDTFFPNIVSGSGVAWQEDLQLTIYMPILRVLNTSTSTKMVVKCSCFKMFKWHVAFMPKVNLIRLCSNITRPAVSLSALCSVVKVELKSQNTSGETLSYRGNHQDKNGDDTQHTRLGMDGRQDHPHISPCFRLVGRLPKEPSAVELSPWTATPSLYRWSSSRPTLQTPLTVCRGKWRQWYTAKNNLGNSLIVTGNTSGFNYKNTIRTFVFADEICGTWVLTEVVCKRCWLMRWRSAVLLW